MADRLASAVRAAMLRTARGALRPVWMAGYRLLARAVAEYVRRGTGAAVFVRGSGLSRDHVLGLSDVDLVAVGPAAARPVMERRRARLATIAPLRAQVDVNVYDEATLAAVRGASALTYPGPLRGEPPVPAGLLLRPYGARRWRRIAGRAPAAAGAALPAREERLAGWLELQHWWRYAFSLCARPARPDAALLALKLYVEPTRVVLGRDAPALRADVLRAGLRRLPEEEAALREALALARGLPTAPAPPLDAALGYLLRTTRRVAAHYEQDLAERGAVAVEIVGDGVLGDRRALTGPEPLADPFTPDPGDAARSADVVAAARAAEDGAYRVLAADGVAVLPTLRPWPRGLLRGVQCAPSDPVLFALLEGERSARFPAVPGWSIADAARSAVAEHHAWLARERVGGIGTTKALGRLVKAARAALLAETLSEGAPRLALTPAATAEVARERDGALADAVAVAAEHLERGEVRWKAVALLDAAVRRMEPYADLPGARRHDRAASAAG